MHIRSFQALTTFLVFAGVSGVQSFAEPSRGSESSTVSVKEAPQRPPGKGTHATLSMTELMSSVNQRALGVAAARKIRLAVIPIKGTDSPRYSDKGFGAFITEKISSSIGAPDSPIRLFERTRLDAVLKEQALSASGVFDESEARKIGELAPIDYILTGSFVRLDQAIAINLRFIDVVTGEVRGSISENLELTPDLAVLFQDMQAVSTRPAVPSQADGTTPSPCEPQWAPIKALMEDLGTPAKLDKLVNAAMALPFEPPCGDIHETLIYHLLRHKQQSPRYGEFLLQTLRKVEKPDADHRDEAILSYLMAPGQLEDPAWNAALKVGGLSERFRPYLEKLIADKEGTEASRRRLQDRIGIILQQLDQKKIGRPVPLDSKVVFGWIMSSLHYTFAGGRSTTKDFRPLMACYQTYGEKYAGDSDKELLRTLIGVYETSTPGKDRDRILDWICGRINRFPPSRELESSVVTLLRTLIGVRNKALKTDPSGGPTSVDLKRLASLSGKRIAELIPLIRDQDQRLEITGYCLENGIKAQDIVPDLGALSKGLSSEDVVIQREAIRLLKYLGREALPVEPVVLKQLRRADHKPAWDDRNKRVQRDLVSLLGAFKTANPEAHEALINDLKVAELGVANEVVLALVSIGEPAAAALKEAFSKVEDPSIQIRIIKVFQLRGKDAASHRAWLKSILETKLAPNVKDAVEDAIEALS